ncbi:MAG: hypothetical protein ACQEP7_06550, partial [bacterium]
ITNGRQGLLPDTSPKANVPTLEITAPFSLLQTDIVTDGSLAEKSLFLGEEGQINWKTWPEKNVSSRLTINGNPVLSGARKANGATWEPEDSGFKKGVIELPGANPAWAGRWYFSFPVHEKVKIYFAGKSPAVDLARYLLAERIQTVQQPGEAQLILIGSRNYPEGFNELLPDEKVADIPRLVLLDKKFNRAEFTSLTAPVAFPWQIEGPLQFESPQPVSVTNRRQLLRSPLTKKARDLTIQQLFQVQPKNNDTILFKAGDKRLLARKDNWYILTVPPESFLREESISTVWPSVFSNIIFSAVKREGSRGWTTGQKQILPEKYNYPLQVTTPDDSQVNVSSPGPFIPTKPGFYKIEDDSGEKYILAANRKRSPEDFKSFDPEKVGGNIEEFQGFAPRTAQPLTPWLWMTLLLMFGIDLYFTPE